MDSVDIVYNEVEIEHCQHCKPIFCWIQNKPGKPPQFMFKGFPTNGQVVLSASRVIVFCSRCVGSMLDGLLRPMQSQ